MDNIDLRQAILNRVLNNSKEQLTEVIQGSVGNDERALPGLGVLFEMIWQQSSNAAQHEMVNTLFQHLQAADSAAVSNPSPS